jgi:hypothetical protein
MGLVIGKEGDKIDHHRRSTNQYISADDFTRFSHLNLRFTSAAGKTNDRKSSDSESQSRNLINFIIRPACRELPNEPVSQITLAKKVLVGVSNYHH